MSMHLKFGVAIAKVPLTLFGFFLCWVSPSLAGQVDIKSYGHSAILIKGGGKSVLLNPFKAVSCASGLLEPRVTADVILASSELADEGARLSKGKFLVKPGSYRIAGMSIEGFAVPHDRLGGRRFGQATGWHWTQAGLSFAHLGGSAGSLTGENKVLIGRPDVLIIAVGGGAKVYDGIEAAKVVRQLKPKRVIPVQYVKGMAPKNCDQNGVSTFLDAMNDIQSTRVGSSVTFPVNLSDKMVINLMH